MINSVFANPAISSVKRTAWTLRFLAMATVAYFVTIAFLANAANAQDCEPSSDSSAATNESLLSTMTEGNFVHRRSRTKQNELDAKISEGMNKKRDTNSTFDIRPSQKMHSKELAQPANRERVRVAERTPDRHGKRVRSRSQQSRKSRQSNSTRSTRKVNNQEPLQMVETESRNDSGAVSVLEDRFARNTTPLTNPSVSNPRSTGKQLSEVPKHESRENVRHPNDRVSKRRRSLPVVSQTTANARRNQRSSRKLTGAAPAVEKTAARKSASVKKPSDVLLDQTTQRVSANPTPESNRNPKSETSMTTQSNVFQTRNRSIAINGGLPDSKAARKVETERQIAPQKSQLVSKPDPEPQSHGAGFSFTDTDNSTFNNAAKNAGFSSNDRRKNENAQSTFPQLVSSPFRQPDARRKGASQPVSTAETSDAQLPDLSDPKFVEEPEFEIDNRTVGTGIIQDSEIESLNSMQSETIESPLPTSRINELAADLVQSNNHRGTAATSNTDRKSAVQSSAATGWAMSDDTQVKGVFVNFGDTAPRSIQQLDSLDQAESAVGDNDGIVGETEAPDENDELELEDDEEEADPENEIEQQRSQYRSDLLRPIAAMPAQMVFSYVDDNGDQVPVSDDRRSYLLDFDGYHNNPYSVSSGRVDQFGCWWESKFAVWKSPDLCYQPLYYEDVNLERYGARHPFLQPGISALHFFGSTVRLPYMMALDPVHECQYSAGFGRPGNKYCYQRERFVWSWKAGSFQTLLVTAAVFGLP